MYIYLLVLIKTNNLLIYIKVNFQFFFLQAFLAFKGYQK